MLDSVGIPRKQEWFQRRKQNQLETEALVCYTKWKRLLRFIENIIIVIIVIFYQYLLKRVSFGASMEK